VNRSAQSVLIVDDDEDLLRLLKIRLAGAGYRVSAASSAEEALQVVARDAPDIVVSDMRMDGMDGMALFRKLHADNPLLPVIILTAHGTIPDAVAATQQGVFAFLTKPFESSDLLDCVARAMRVTANGAAAAPEHDAAAWDTGIICRSRSMLRVLGEARRAATSDASILIQSESGTGKELLARAVHRASPRHAGPFVAVNCSAIPEQLLESELFGHVRGAFTGATRDRAGLLREADGGTLFLDEIGDMPLLFQAKLLRVLQDHEVRPVGASRSVAVDVRVISATHKNLEQALMEGSFREDLYYRLNVIQFELPSLRERQEDIPLLANHFLAQLGARSDRPPRKFSPEAMERLISAAWPGNVRQLMNVVEQTALLTPGRVIPASQVDKALRQRTEQLESLAVAREAFERDYLVRLLQITDGNISQASRIAERNRTEFYKLLKRHRLDPGLFRNADTPGDDV
jgi:two-component system response regulator GlrR